MRDDQLFDCFFVVTLRLLCEGIQDADYSVFPVLFAEKGHHARYQLIWLSEPLQRPFQGFSFCPHIFRRWAVVLYQVAQLLKAVVENGTIVRPYASGCWLVLCDCHGLLLLARFGPAFFCLLGAKGLCQVRVTHAA